MTEFCNTFSKSVSTEFYGTFPKSVLNKDSLYELAKLMTINELVFFMRNMPEYANPNGTYLERILVSNDVWFPKIKEYMLTKKDEEADIRKNAYQFIKENWNLPYKRYYFNETKSGVKLLRNKQIYHTLNGKVSHLDQSLIPMQRDILNLYSSMHYFAIYVNNPKGVFVTSGNNPLLPDEDELVNEHNPINLEEIEELRGLELKYVHYSFDTLIFLTNKGLYMYEHQVGCGEIMMSATLAVNPEESDDGRVIDLELGDPQCWAHVVSNNNLEMGIRIGPYMPPRNRQQYPQYILKTKTKTYKGYIGNFPGTDNNSLVMPVL